MERTAGVIANVAESHAERENAPRLDIASFTTVTFVHRVAPWSVVPSVLRILGASIA